MPLKPEYPSPAFDPGPSSGPERAEGPAPGVGGPAAGQVPEPATAVSPSPQRIPRWLERSELFLRVLLRMYIGLAVCCVPWMPMFWDRNPLFVQFPSLAIYAANGAVRGIITGLGFLNLWIAFHDAIRHRDG